MPEILTQCQQCDAKLRLQVRHDQRAVRVRCPECDSATVVQVGEPVVRTATPEVKTAVKPAAKPRKAIDPSPDQHTSLPGFQDATTFTPARSRFQNVNGAASEHWDIPPPTFSPAKNDFDFRWVLYPAGGVVLLILGVYLSLLFMRLTSGFIQSSPAFAFLSTVSRESIAENLVELTDELESELRWISLEERETEGVKILDRYVPRFERILNQACGLSIEKIQWADYEPIVTDLSTELGARSSPDSLDRKAREYPWRYLSAISEQEIGKSKWATRAMRVRDLKSAAINVIHSRLRFEDPSSYRSEGLDWSDEGRKQLRACYIESQMLGDLALSMAQIISGSAEAGREVRNMQGVIDRATSQTKEIEVMEPVSRVRRVSIQHDREFARQAALAWVGFSELRRIFEREQNQKGTSVSPAMKFLLEDVTQMHEAIVEMCYGNLEPIRVLDSKKHAERYAAAK